ncbi:MAG: NAD-dependent epimerase/dehydratase family protein [Rhizobiales bacterium]|nr:NAD-dependent epimerase/dehydratase family protein [Hyphomicrobiales bacterium]
MLEHLNSSPQNPERVVVIGAGGFVGGAIMKRLGAEGVQTLGLTRKDVDLMSADAGAKLAGYLKPSDAVVAVSAIAPVKNLNMLKENLDIISAIAAALSASPVSHVLNIGSDAIYADSDGPLSEASCASPASAHGIMHLAREVTLGDAAGDTPFATLRPTLIYGADDPHNGYGPNRFRRLAAQGQDIVLFGEGEERRDHVWVEDVAELATRILLMRSQGVLNAATGTVISFRDAAEAVVGHFPEPASINGSPRVGPMPHNGYRPFDPAATAAAFPDFAYTQPEDGFAKVHAQMAER